MAFKRWNKAPSKKTPKRAWSESEMKIVGWCLNNNIKVGISPDWKGGLNNWIIEIKINNNIHTDPNVYNENVVYDKVLEYYNYYYKPNTNNNG
tara:strand:- start:252 stop:530 length:279 start_codon:yes stop_codon:yes gene_type:complete